MIPANSSARAPSSTASHPTRPHQGGWGLTLESGFSTCSVIKTDPEPIFGSLQSHNFYGTRINLLVLNRSISFRPNRILKPHDHDLLLGVTEQCKPSYLDTTIDT